MDAGTNEDVRAALGTLSVSELSGNRCFRELSSRREVKVEHELRDGCALCSKGPCCEAKVGREQMRGFVRDEEVAVETADEADSETRRRTEGSFWLHEEETVELQAIGDAAEDANLGGHWLVMRIANLRYQEFRSFLSGGTKIRMHAGSWDADGGGAVSACYLQDVKRSVCRVLTGRTSTGHIFPWENWTDLNSKGRRFFCYSFVFQRKHRSVCVCVRGSEFLLYLFFIQRTCGGGCAYVSACVCMCAWVRS